MNPVGGRGSGRGRGYGFGRGFGRGRAWGFGTPYVAPDAPAVAGSYPAPVTTEQELEALKGQAEHLAGVLEGIQARIGELEKAGDT